MSAAIAADAASAPSTEPPIELRRRIIWKFRGAGVVTMQGALDEEQQRRLLQNSQQTLPARRATGVHLG
jgi:hypothetical protein